MADIEAVALSGWPPEVMAYAMAMYSRSRLSVRESIRKITLEKTASFLETFYFQYGHSSIADNAHIHLGIENIPQLAAFELEDEQLWDGQERSTRYQEFRENEADFVPAYVRISPAEKTYVMIAEFLFSQYQRYSNLCFEHLAKKHPKPQDMDQGSYERTMKARAFDVSRYWLPNGMRTSVGQITNARTLERQISRLLSSDYLELVDLGMRIKKAVSVDQPFCPEERQEGPVAPTLIKYAEPNEFIVKLRQFVREAGKRYVSGSPPTNHEVSLVPGGDIQQDIVAALLYEGSQDSLRRCYEATVRMGKSAITDLVTEVAALRGRHDPLPKAFAAGYGIQFDVCMDTGGRRDLHRHRNCVQIHQGFSVVRGFETPTLIDEIGMGEHFRSQMGIIGQRIADLEKSIYNNAHFLIPMAFRAGTLYRMDYRQAEYLTALRSKPGGHFSYRQVACEMDEQLRKFFPGVGMSRVTPLAEEDVFKR